MNDIFVWLFFGIAIFVLFLVFLTFLFFTIWIYKDSKLRGENPLLWILLLFLVPNFLGIIIYLIIRKDKNILCEKCGSLVNNTAKYCENCSATIKVNNDFLNQQIKNRKYIKYAICSFCMILFCVIASIIIMIISIYFTKDIQINKPIINTGFETISKQSKSYNNWNVYVESATKGFVKEVEMEIINPKNQSLYIDTSCDVKKKGGTLQLYMVQDGIMRNVNVTNLNETLEYPLKDFYEGKIFVRLQINNVENIQANVTIK